MAERGEHEWYLDGHFNVVCRNCGLRGPRDPDWIDKADRQPCVYEEGMNGTKLDAG